MGAGQSREAVDDDTFISGVRVTQGLLEQLDGKPRPQRVPTGLAAASGGGSIGGLQALRPQAEEPSLAAAGPDRALARALERSRLVGGQLLKAEEEELGRVDQLAQELLSSQYVAPSRPRPCAQAAEECVRCYAEHADDPLACAAAVEAYGQCAREAWREAATKASGL
ncbi:hypothetical protein ABPG77_007090 [Micractinium sp. CCAP 211/92]